MTDMQTILLIAGGCLFIGAIGCYLKDTKKAIFPSVLALVGVFLFGAQVLKADIPGVGTIELQKFAKETSEAADAVTMASQKNSEAIAAINTTLIASQNAFAEYRKEVNQRFASLNERPVNLPQARQIRESQELVRESIREAESANDNAIQKTDDLRNFAIQRSIRQ